MKNTLLIGILVAIATGSAIGLQASLGSRIGAVITPFRTGLWMNLAGGLIAGMLIVLFRNNEQASGAIPNVVIPMLIVAGSLGVAIIMGVSFSVARTGVAAGLAAGLAGLFLGQMLVGLIVDTRGWGSIESVPLDGRRVLGLALMALAVYLLLPKE